MLSAISTIPLILLNIASFLRKDTFRVIPKNESEEELQDFNEDKHQSDNAKEFHVGFYTVYHFSETSLKFGG